jgi:hypothetical protein
LIFLAIRRHDRDGLRLASVMITPLLNCGEAYNSLQTSAKP